MNLGWPLYWEWDYALGLVLWLLGLVFALRFCLLHRGQARRINRPLRTWNIALATWLLLAAMTGCELVFALLIDASDAFNMTNVSKRWFRRHAESQLNAEGFRDRREFTRTIPDGTQRIWFFGDSFTFGHGVRRREDRFTDLVEQQLNAAGRNPVEVANLASPGWDASLVEGLLRALLDRDYEVQTVVYVFMLNDIEPYDPRTQQVIQSLQQAEPKFFLIGRTYFPNWLYFRYRQAAGSSSDYFPHLAESYNGPAWGGLSRKLEEIANDCKRKQVDFRMVVFPFLHNLGPDYPFHQAHQKLKQWCEEQQIPVLDLEPVLTPHLSEGLTVNRFDAHPNERAHALAAKAIREQLLGDLPQTAAE